MLPGGGQIYNKKWFKLPLTYAIEGGAAAWLIYNNNQFRKYDQIFDELVNGGLDPTGQFLTASQAKPTRDKFRKQTEYAWVFMILAHLYNVFDAYVDRHLMDFDISEDISIQWFPPPTPYSYAAVGLGYRF